MPTGDELGGDTGEMEIRQARRIEAPRWLNARTVVGLVVFSLAFVGAQRALINQRSTVAVWSLARDLPTGATVGPDDLVAREVRLPGDQLDLYALTSTDLVGISTTRPLAAGELVPLGGVVSGDRVGLGRSMSIPIEAEHAVGGALAVGDRIDVFATFSDRRGNSRTVLLVSGVEVIGVVTAGGLVGDQATTGVTVSVTPDDAPRLALALRTGDIDVVRVDAPSAQSSVMRVEGRDL